MSATIKAVTASATACTISDKLVNSCRPWMEGTSNGYPQVASDKKSQVLYLEQRMGRQLDVVHTYHSAGTYTLSADDLYFINRPNTILEADWMITNTWSEAGGSNATINADIDELAKSIIAVSPQKVMISIYHEPESGVTGGASGCSSTVYMSTAKAGTPAQYKAMWQNIRNRFNNLKVTNVVWVVNYMGYSGFNCMVNDLYPGDDLVDWIVWDPYADNDSSIWPTDNALHLYTFLTDNSNSSHDYLSKTWGLAEAGACGSTAAFAHQQYVNMKSTVDNNTMPRMKMWAIFDEYGTYDHRVDYNCQTHDIDATAQKDFNSFANDSKLK
jgi:beta-mannanase